MEVTRTIQLEATVVFRDVDSDAESVESAKEQRDFIKKYYTEMFEDADQVLVEVKDFIREEE